MKNSKYFVSFVNVIFKMTPDLTFSKKNDLKLFCCLTVLLFSMFPLTISDSLVKRSEIVTEGHNSRGP